MKNPENSHGVNGVNEVVVATVYNIATKTIGSSQSRLKTRGSTMNPPNLVAIL